jgi:ribosomal protein S18 acetylase RimI-like enzyme
MKGNQITAVMVAEAKDADRAIGVLTLAFSDDPANRWLFPEAAQYLQHFPTFARALGGAALQSGTAHVDGDYSAVALWLAPDVGPDEQALTRLIEHAVAPDKRDDMAAVVDQMGRHHPSEPHWYLPFIGVEPMRRNLGLGTALLRKQLAACDAARLPAYLESTNPRNRALYERHGFEAVAEIKAGSCPPVIPMVRRPR